MEDYFTFDENNSIGEDEMQNLSLNRVSGGELCRGPRLLSKGGNVNLFSDFEGIDPNTFNPDLPNTKELIEYYLYNSSSWEVIENVIYKGVYDPLSDYCDNFSSRGDDYKIGTKYIFTMLMYNPNLEIDLENVEKFIPKKPTSFVTQSFLEFISVPCPKGITFLYKNNYLSNDLKVQALDFFAKNNRPIFLEISGSDSDFESCLMEKVSTEAYLLYKVG